jgi:hypothetical protein
MTLYAVEELANTIVSRLAHKTTLITLLITAQFYVILQRHHDALRRRGFVQTQRRRGEYFFVSFICFVVVASALTKSFDSAITMASRCTFMSFIYLMHFVLPHNSLILTIYNVPFILISHRSVHGRAEKTKGTGAHLDPHDLPFVLTFFCSYISQSFSHQTVHGRAEEEGTGARLVRRTAAGRGTY